MNTGQNQRIVLIFFSDHIPTFRIAQTSVPTCRGRSRAQSRRVFGIGVGVIYCGDDGFVPFDAAQEVACVEDGAAEG